MDYVLPIIINDRRINYLELHKSQLNGAIEPFKNTMESFIVELPSFGNFNLLSLDKLKSISALKSGLKDILYDKCSYRTSWDATQKMIKINIHSTIQDKIDFEELINDNIKFLAKNSSDDFRVDGIVMNRLTDDVGTGMKITCKIQLSLEKDDYEGCIILHIAHPLQVVSCGLDFGSEASQLTSRKTTSLGGNGNFDYTPSLIKLFDAMNSEFPHEKALKITIRDYLQYEEGTPFYKSIFFMEKKIDNYLVELNNVFLPNDKANLTLISTLEDIMSPNYRDNKLQLPNLKLARKYHHNIDWLDFNFVQNNKSTAIEFIDLKDKAYASILKAILLSWLKKVNFFKDENRSLVRITLLVPNIFENIDINYIRSVLDNIVSQINEIYPNHKILGWEFVTISESDASFLGYYDNYAQGIEENKYYILVDCGKGTTDYSIIKTGIGECKSEFEPIYRNGFAGAGNLITFAFFKTIVSLLVEHAVINNINKIDIDNDLNYFKKTISNAAANLVNSFYEQIEGFKRNYKDDISSIVKYKESWETSTWGVNKKIIDFIGENATLSDINGYLKNISGIPDEYGYIRESCEQIANNVISNLRIVVKELIKKKQSCGGILFTGRGFLFKPLNDCFMRLLGQVSELKEVQISTLNKEADFKNICMKGIFNNSYIYNPDMVGTPLQIEKIRTVRTTQINKEIKNWLGRLLDTWEQNLEKGEFKVKNFNPLDGSWLDSDIKNHKFLIGNKLFVPQNIANIKTRNRKFSLVFTKEAIYLRSFHNDELEEVNQLIHSGDIDQNSDNQMLPSMFPSKIDWKFAEQIHSVIMKKK